MQVQINIHIDDRLVAWSKRIFRPRVLGTAAAVICAATAVVASAAQFNYTAFSPGQVISSKAVNADFEALFASSWDFDGGDYYVVTPQGNADPRVGIGTAAPVDDLHVYSPAGNETVAMFESANQANGTFVGFTDHVGGFTSATAEIGSVSGNLILGNPANLSGLNVGIGTATPTVPLSINAPGTQAATLAQGSGYFEMGSDDNTNMALDYSSIQVRNAGAGAALTLQRNGGTVTIGSTSTNSSLTVEGTASATGTISGSNYQSGISLHVQAGDNGTASCTAFCERYPANPTCVTGTLSGTTWSDGGAYVGCTLQPGLGFSTSCLCAGF